MLILINFLFVGTLVVAAIFMWLRTNRVKQTIDWQVEESNCLISISVPKNNDKTPLAAEQMFAALHGIFRAGSNIQPQISFEIVSRNNTITFYVYTPLDLKDFVIGQIYAQYPNVETAVVELEHDYTQLSQGKHLAATELTLKRDPVFPIKTFQNFEVDPLSAITGVLSALNQDEEIWIQTIVRPVDDDWQDKGEKVIKDVKEPPKHKGWMELVIGEAASLATHAVRTIINPSAEPDKSDKPDDKKDVPGTAQQAIKGIEEKITKLGYQTTIRILAAGPDPNFTRAKLEQIVGAFKQFNSININSFIMKEVTTDQEVLKLFRSRTFGQPEMIFNITELASIYHYPSETVSTPTIAWAGSKKGEPPANLPLDGVVPSEELTLFASTSYRNESKKFGIKRNDRRLHTYIIGKTGTGKSTLLENMIIDDINEGRGLAVVDPHGELIHHILNFIPESRINDVVYFNPADADNPVGFNLLENVNPELKNVVASGVIGIFKKIFGESWGPRLEYILRNAVLALLEYPNSTLLGVMRILTDAAYRHLVVNEVKDPVIRDFFVNEYEKYDPKFRTEAIAPIQNKVGQFLSSSTIRNIVGQPRSTTDIGDIMNSGKILLADFSVGKIGEDNSLLLGSMLITKIQLAAMSRTNISEIDRQDFYLYVDEFQTFATDSFASILSEARKYRLNLIMTHQYIAQMPETVSNAVFGNVGTIVSFRVGAGDAEVLQREFEPVFDVNDLVNLDNYHIYLKMAIDGVTVPAFSAKTLPPRGEAVGFIDHIIEASRRQFTRPRSDVEDYIAEWSAPIDLSNHSTPVAVSEIPKDKGFVEAQKKIEDEVRPSVSQSTPETQPKMTEASQPSQTVQEPESSAPIKTVPEGTKVEILKDRFSRNWYAVTGPKQPVAEPVSVGEAEKENPKPPINEMGETSEFETNESLPTLLDINTPEAGDWPRNEMKSNNSEANILEKAGESDQKINEQPLQNTDTQTNQSGGVGERIDENSDLITWDKAEELAVPTQNNDQIEPLNHQPNQIQPIEEIQD